MVDSIIRNWANYLFVHAVAHPRIDYDTRLEFFDKANAIYNNLKLNQDTRIFAPSVEKERLLAVKEFLVQQSEFVYLVPGRQMLDNPDFINGMDDWIQYNSNWQTEELNIIGRRGNTAVFSRQGDGHSSLSQQLLLMPGHCYLFSVVGKTKRHDDIRTLWLYWDTYNDEGKPQGNMIIHGHDNKDWTTLYGVFCLDESDKDRELINIAPVNIYGDVTSYIDSVRLYELTYD